MAGKFEIETIFTAKDNITKPVGKIRSKIKNMTRSANRGFVRLNRAINKTNEKMLDMAKSAGRLGIVISTGIVVGLAMFVKEASKIEDAVAVFTPLLGGAKNAEKAVALLNKTAASTPFQFDTLSKAANTLIGFGAATLDTLVPTLRMLGDTAGGSSDKLGRIALAFSKIKAAGKADMQDLNMLIDSGIPIFSELEKLTGKNTAALRKMSSQGKITAELIDRAFKQMTSRGGKFFEGMVIASKTQSGLLSTLRDNLLLTAAAIGKELLPFSKTLTLRAIEITGKMRAWVTANKELINLKLGQTVRFITENLTSFKDVLVGLISLLKVYVIIMVSLKALTIAWTVSQVALTAATWLFTVAQAVSNTLMGAQAVLTKLSMGQMVLYRVAMFGAIAALSAFHVAMGIAKVAMIAFNVAMRLNPIGFIIGLVMLLVAAGVLLVKNWDSVKEFFSGMWDGILEMFNNGVEKIKSILGFISNPIKLITSAFSKIKDSASLKALVDVSPSDVNFNTESNDSVSSDSKNKPQIISPQEQIKREIISNQDSMDINIIDNGGNAKVTKKPKMAGVNLNLQTSGVF